MPKIGYKQTKEHKLRALMVRNTPKGEAHVWWKGGKIANGEGRVYVYSPNHPYKVKGGYVQESRLIMERKIGRYLLPSEVVHHKNKDVTDNEVENLVLFSSHGKHLKHEWGNGVYDKRGQEWKEKLSQAHKLVYLNRERDSLGRFI